MASLNALLQALDTQFPANRSRFPLGNTCAHYTADIAQMEGLSRALWGLFPLMASGESTPFSEKYLLPLSLVPTRKAAATGVKLARTISVWWRWRPTVWGSLCWG